ncbi:MAG: twin-arginine translocation signal domain-containing protein, partial [Planctomycetota bacterium]
MQRRQFLKTTGLAAAGMLLNRSELLAASGERPLNFIVIMADDLGAKELGCYGNK